MQEEERDVLQIPVFDEIEETLGTWLRAIMQRLEKELARFWKCQPHCCWCLCFH